MLTYLTSKKAFHSFLIQVFSSEWVELNRGIMSEEKQHLLMMSLCVYRGPSFMNEFPERPSHQGLRVHMCMCD